MCWISWVNLSLWSVDWSRLKASNAIMHHRWPDASLIWISDDDKTWFWHVRLSIVDLDTRSTQPFSIDNGRYIMVFNGEIYNYKKLRNELIKKYGISFLTTSDTEVLIYMYKFFWKECLDKIEGMFAFAIYDKKEDTLFIARDFVWQKPLVYIEDESGFYFASEIPWLFALHPNFQKEIDINVIKVYMMSNFSHIPNNFSAFKNVHKLENASYLIIQSGKIIEKWKYDALKKHSATDGNEIDFLDAKIDEMRPSDVGYASFLSGWIDSSFVCSSLKNHEIKQTEAYTLRIWDNDEDYERSKFVAKTLWLKHTIGDIGDFDFIKSIDESIKILWEPYFHITSIFADKILQIAKQNHKVFFTGAWWDECYYWYNNLLFIAMEGYFRCKWLIPQFIIRMLDKFTKFQYTSILNANARTFKQIYYKENFKKISHLFANPADIDESIMKITDDLFNFAEMKNYIDVSYMFGLFVENMHSLVIQWDLIGMKNSIEIRSVFLEREVIKRTYSIPFWRKVSLFRLNEWKEILRRQLMKIFPKDFIYAKKIGFWVKYDFKEVFEKKYYGIVTSKIDLLMERWIFNKQNISKLLLDFRWNFQLIMKLYTLEIWMETFIDNHS